MEKDKRLMEAFWWERLTEGKSSLVLMVRPMLGKSLIQISVDGQDCVPSLLFDQRPNYDGDNEDNGNLLQKVPCTHCCTQCLQPCSRPLQTYVSTSDSWKHVGKSGLVTFGVTAHFSWVLVHKRFCLCHLRVCFPVLCKFWRLCGGVNGDLLQEGLFHSQVYCIQSPCSWSNPLLTHTSTRDAQTQFCLSLCGSLGPGVHKVYLSPLSVSGEYGVWF